MYVCFSYYHQVDQHYCSMLWFFIANCSCIFLYKILCDDVSKIIIKLIDAVITVTVSKLILIIIDSGVII